MHPADMPAGDDGKAPVAGKNDMGGEAVDMQRSRRRRQGSVDVKRHECNTIR